MSVKITIMIIMALSIVFNANRLCLGNDFDDGISIDDKITDTLKSSTNLKFVMLKAKARAKGDSDNNLTGSDSIKNGSLNSVLIGPGSNVNGDIYIIDESKGSQTVVVD